MSKHFKVTVYLSTAGIKSVNRHLSLNAFNQLIQTQLSLIYTFKSSLGWMNRLTQARCILKKTT